MMSAPSRIAMAATTIAIGAALLTMPAHSQTADTFRSIVETPLDHPIDFYRDLARKGAKLAVQDDFAETEIVVISPPPAARGGIVISENPHAPYACGYVTPLLNRNRQRFIHYFNSDKTVLFSSLKDLALVDEMAWCRFLPKPPWPPPDEYFWGNLNLKY